FLEGNNNRLKMIKRTMYGRAGLDLLRAKIIH
ncbi:MAG TPA: transposase, partial [Desulfosporosinus sp.]|nr:transposase [Desulfosporosinus sp.]